MIKIIALIFCFISWASAAYYHDIKGTEFLRDENPKDFPEEIVKKTLNVFPGTKWCGEDIQAKNDDDLGEYPETDRCCRYRVLDCKTMSPGEAKWSLENKYLFLVAECSCDETMLKCLKATNEKIAVQIRYVFYGIQHPQCFNFTDKSETKAEWSTPIRDPELARQLESGQVKL